jgi:hypothetical protein
MSTAYGKRVFQNDRSGSLPDHAARHPTVPLPRVKRKDPSGKLTCTLEFPLSGVFRA